ncbi:hypothetical protein GCM10011583_71720 [Streptomyces camponoticapitis]|uniref:Uncharacterized protein n=1 Tax=Streptomyces camponoticapitis TaxID=1616125 RepID=A0ABQ2EZS9_9ACTN|nr:hypothetical protein GCM10011583_71720 [Streptomyces camponoticapitis]
MSLEKRVEAMEMGTGAVRHGHSRSYLAWSGLPSLLTRQDRRAKKLKRKRCELCGPDPL